MTTSQEKIAELPEYEPLVSSVFYFAHINKRGGTPSQNVIKRHDISLELVTVKTI